MEQTKEKWIGYLRVSTDDKGQTFDQQISEINLMAEDAGAEVIGFYSDEVSGKINDRKGLRLAMAKARENNAVVVVSRADRLTRDLPFALQLIFKSGIKFRCLDMSEDAMSNELICSVYWGVASIERKNTSLRVRAKHREIKTQYDKANAMFAEGKSIEEIVEACPLAKNTILNGNYEPGAWGFGIPVASRANLTQQAANAKRVKNADTNRNSVEAAREVKEFIKNYQGTKGILSAAAKHLSEMGFLTPRGTTKHTAQSVKNLCKRFDIEI